jgi:ectoine hydroxylase-related dioxygenase (phytanoyl-CoA dioxygenase family)
MEASETYFIEATGHAIDFLQKLDTDQVLQKRCMLTHLEGRLDIAFELGFDFSVENLRVAIRIWDYHGNWRKWASEGLLTEDISDFPSLSEPYALSDEHIHTYREKGHVLLREVASKYEMDVYRPAIQKAVKQFEPETLASSLSELKSFEDAGFISVLNLRERDEVCRRFVLAKRFGKIAADLLGVDRVRVYLDETFNKSPGGCQTHWHQDNTYFPLDTDQLITLWMPIKDTSTNMGTLSFASKSHREANCGYFPITQNSDEHFASFIGDRHFDVYHGTAMNAGDATFHNGWMLHRSAPNTSNQLREAMTIVFYPDGTKLAPASNIYLERAIKHGFKANPGDLAVSPIHPIVYDRNAK